MNRKEFLKTTLMGAAALMAAPALAGSVVSAAGRKGTADQRATAAPRLNISFQEGTAPGENLAQKFDWMEAHGVTGFEPGGKNLGARVAELKNLLRGRNIKVTAICAGFEGFILAEDPAVKAAFDSSMRDIIVAAGELGSVGVIMVPAFNGQKPCRPHTLETREFLCEEMGKLGEFALQHGTTAILEPLNRREAFYLRQVGDGAAIARDSGSKGVTCMGDFWHMSEEASDYGALWSADGYLSHVHIASRGRRIMPGEDGELDNYVDGFRALKEMNYEGWVSFECGTRGEREQTVTAALELMREQWARA
ncbi:MAG: sugar phosphate isomerase/epimerase [Alistipes sp.]|jgi:sugar phosphate isomerase/epimerase|nr:sugar phosphate isomerase/epimerase [Alistipes sp.]